MNWNGLVLPDEQPDKYLDMPEGLDGYWWETENQICIPVVENKHEGDGTFSKWLTSLESRGKIIFFPTIISARLEAILRKRGYVDAIAPFSKKEREIYGEQYCEGLAKKCSQSVMRLEL
jgi:hypothetical protein